MRLLQLGVLLGLAACATPPQSAYIQFNGNKPVKQIAVGNNAVGEPCTVSSSGEGGTDVYCGTWQQPSARIRPGERATDAQLRDLAIASPWRAGIDQRFICQAPTATSILGGQPAELMQCTQKIGGWPHAAVVALIRGQVWYGDAVLPAATIMERAMGVQAGLISASAAPPSSAADALFAQRLAAQAFKTGDINDYQQLMSSGTQANLADNGGAAEAAFRAALAVQQKALGQNNPNTATAMMTLALQLSDEGRFAEADQLFATAATLAPKSDDATAQARLLHYRGLDAINRERPAEALALLQQAESGYGRLVPPSALRAKRTVLPVNSFLHVRSPVGAPLVSDQDIVDNPTARLALVGVVEARRNEALALRELGRLPESQAKLASANELAGASGVARPVVEARLYRTTGATEAASGNLPLSLASYANSGAAFSRSLPGSKPLADVYLLRAGELARSGDFAAMLPICRNAVASLVALKAGTRAELISPCLDAYAASISKQADPGQALAAEMFLAAQLMQGGITSEQIAQATARLEENARDPRVAQAIRRREDASVGLQTLYRQRDALAASGNGTAAAPGAAADLDKRITAAQAALADADAALQAASPNYGQLVQQVVPASAVLSALRPHEGFISIVLGPSDGWEFLLRDGRITIARIAGGQPRIAQLVAAIRRGIEQTSAGVPPFNIAAARELYDATLAQFGTGLDGASAVTIAPTGPLLSLPFEVLLTGPADNGNLAGAPWLLRKFAISHVPAPANFVSLRRVASGSRATEPWFGFGDFLPMTLAQARASFPTASCAESAQLLAGLPPLPFARKELEAARLIMGASAQDELLGRAFTVPDVMKAQLTNFRILHFATHAILPAELACQSEPAIITSPPPGATSASGALLTATDVTGLNLDADLVILSACNSGGPNGSTAGESLSGLARAFFFAGARALLVTHWDVNDQTAAYLIAQTLQRIRTRPDLGPAEALRETQLDILANAGRELPAEIAHPYFWAPFALIGEGGGFGPGVAVRS